jgi:hypothetical protein
MAGKVKVTESLVNVVIGDEPKRLEGCGAQAKTAMRRIPPLSAWGTRTGRCTTDMRDLTQQNVTTRNEVSLMLRHMDKWQVGPQGELTGQQVEDGTRSERGSVMEPIETLCLTVKTGPLVSGHHREITRRTVS